MKLIIDIDEDLYELIKHDVNMNGSDYKPFVLIANGTPYKPSGDLISREALKEYVKEIEDYESANTICGYIDNAPTVY